MLGVSKMLLVSVLPEEELGFQMLCALILDSDRWVGRWCVCACLCARMYTYVYVCVCVFRLQDLWISLHSDPLLNECMRTGQ